MTGQTPSSPVNGFSTSDEALSYYKSQYEQLEAELADFQASSRELETELEKDIEASERRERQLKEKVEGLGYEVDEWKVRKPLQSKRLDTSFRSSTDCVVRPNTSSRKAKPTQRKTRCRRKLQPSVTPIEQPN